MIPLCVLRHGKLLALLLCLFFLALGFGQTCSASGNYVITGNELGELNSILEQLETLNTRLKNELTISKENLLALGNELDVCKTDLAALRNCLARSREESIALGEQLLIAANSLEQAEKSFNEYTRAVQSRIRKLTIQRNLAILAALVALVI